MLTRLQMFQKAHPSSFKASFEAICHLSGLTLKKTYYHDKNSGFTIQRSASFISTSEGGWNHSPNAQEIDKAFKEASEEAEVYKHWCKHWAEEETRIYSFGSHKVHGTKKDNGVLWEVWNQDKKTNFCIFTPQKEISEVRAEIVFLNYLGRVNAVRKS